MRAPRLHQVGFFCLVTLSSLAAFSGCSRSNAPAEPAGAPPQILRISQRNEPGDLDPARITLSDEFAVLRALSEGLLIPGQNGAPPRPGAAERFTVSDDGLTYTFHLRREARWSNGEPVTADDFLSSFRRALTPATAAPKAQVFFPVRNARAYLAGEITDFSQVGFRAADAHTLVVTLAQPYPRFPYYVASGPWIPVNPRVVARHGAAWTKPENFVGNGPFVLGEWRPHQHLALARNPHWHGAARLRLDGIRFVHFDNGDAEERAYRAGQVDATIDVPRTKVEGYARERPAELHRLPMIETRYLTFNTRRPPLDDVRVRQALAQAIDRERIAEHVLLGRHPASERFLPPGLRAAGANDAATTSSQSFAPAHARQLLAEAGFPDGRGLRRLELTAWSQSQVPVLEAIQAMWRAELGVEVALATRDAKVHVAALTTGDYDIGFITAIPDVADPFELLADFTSTSPGNYAQWHDAAFDQLLEAALAARSPAEHGRQLLAAERRLLDAAAVAPLYFNTKVWLMSPRIRGWHEDGLWTRCYDTIHFQ